MSKASNQKKLNETQSFRLLTSLLNYLSNNKSRLFRTGKWVETLSDSDLISLKKQVKTISDCSCGITITAYSAETGSQKLNIELEKLMGIHNMLFVIATFEELRRKGFVLILKPLSIQLETLNEYKITEEGTQAIKTEKDSFTLKVLNNLI